MHPESNRRSQTIVKVGRPGLSLIPGSTDVIYAPLDTTVGTRRDYESMFDDTHCLKSGLKHVRYTEISTINRQMN